MGGRREGAGSHYSPYWPQTCPSLPDVKIPLRKIGKRLWRDNIIQWATAMFSSWSLSVSVENGHGVLNTNHCRSAASQRKDRLFPGLRSRRRRACLSSSPDSKPLAGRPTNKEAPNVASTPTHSASPSPTSKNQANGCTNRQTPGSTVA